MTLLDTALRFSGIHYPTPLKRVWIALILLSLLLKLIVICRVRLMAFAPYMLVCCVASVTSTLQNTHFWGFKWEIAQAVSLLAFTAEIIFLSPFGVPHKWARHYDRQVAMICGMTLLAVMLFWPPAPFPNFPKSMYYIHLYSTAVCLACVVGSAVQAYDMRGNLQPFLKWHTLIAIPWIGSIVAAGFFTERGESPYYTAYFASASIRAAVQVICLIGWITVQYCFGSKRAENRYARTFDRSGVSLLRNP